MRRLSGILEKKTGIIISISLLLLFLLSSCRDYENVPYQAPGTRTTLIFSSDSLTINRTTPGNFINQDYYENISNFMDSIRVDFTGTTNIDSNNSCTIVVQAIDESNNSIIKNYLFDTPGLINQSYSLGFKISGINAFILYFNLNLIVNMPQAEGVYLRIKNIKVYNVY